MAMWLPAPSATSQTTPIPPAPSRRISRYPPTSVPARSPAREIGVPAPRSGFCVMTPTVPGTPVATWDVRGFTVIRSEWNPVDLPGHAKPVTA